jgi:hypothetical protein
MCDNWSIKGGKHHMSKPARHSALFKLQLAQLGAGTHNTAFIAQSAVDDELRELAGLSDSSQFPTGHIGSLRVQVIPDVVVVDTHQDWRGYLNQQESEKK